MNGDVRPSGEDWPHPVSSVICDSDVRSGPCIVAMDSATSPGYLYQSNMASYPGHNNIARGSVCHKNVIVFEPNGHVVMSTEDGSVGRYDPEGAVSVDPSTPPSPSLAWEELVDSYREEPVHGRKAAIKCEIPSYKVQRGVACGDMHRYVKNPGGFCLMQELLKSPLFGRCLIL